MQQQPETSTTSKRAEFASDSGAGSKSENDSSSIHVIEKEAPSFRFVKLAEETAKLLEPITMIHNEAESLSSQTTSERKDGKDDSSLGWTHPELTVLGLYFPLGPCQIRMKQATLGGILSGLPDIFRQLSFHVEYQNSPISATCRSMNQVELEVSFFASRTNSDDDMIVEVACIYGDTMSFHEYSQAILSAISTMHEDHDNGLHYNSINSQRPYGKSTTPGGASSCPASWNCNILRQADTLMSQPLEGSSDLTKSTIEQEWERAYRFLLTDRYDAQCFGMEMLIQMTDPNRSGWSVAVQTTELLLCPTTETQESIARGILEWALNGSACEESNNTSNADSSYKDLFDSALVVLTQALQVAVESKKTLDFTTKFWQTHAVRTHDNNTSNRCIHSSNANLLLECLFRKINGVYSHPHSAYLAMRSLLALCGCVPALRAQILLYNNNDTEQYPNVWSVVEAAQSFGDSHHLALATASQQLLVCLQQA